MDAQSGGDIFQRGKFIGGSHSGDRLKDALKPVNDGKRAAMEGGSDGAAEEQRNGAGEERSSGVVEYWRDGAGEDL
jgi:hypothetical protein